MYSRRGRVAVRVIIISVGNGQSEPILRISSIPGLYRRVFSTVPVH